MSVQPDAPDLPAAGPDPAPGGAARRRFSPSAILLPLGVAAALVLFWHLAVRYKATWGPTDAEELTILKRRIYEFDRDDFRKTVSAAEVKALASQANALGKQAAQGEVDRSRLAALAGRLDELDERLDLGQNERYPCVRHRLGPLSIWDRGAALFPPPAGAVRSMVGLLAEGKLHRYVLASLVRVVCGFGAAVVLGVPLGLLMGWFLRVRQALNPIMQVLRPISPIAWIPVAILWFGIGELAPIFLIFLASIFPITVSAAAAVRNIQPVYLRAARNFGLGRLQLFSKVILPATFPQIITGVRIALGVAWLVVVAAEMIVSDVKVGGLGYMINDGRAQGTGYGQVVAGMVLIGLVGLVLDLLVRQLEKYDEIRWAYANQ
jgi:NitT/TauT family transport system permease protein